RTARAGVPSDRPATERSHHGSDEMSDVSPTGHAPVDSFINSSNLPVLFVVVRDPGAFNGLLSDLSRRFGNDFAVRGKRLPEAALDVLEDLATARQAVALLLVDDAASASLLSRAH